MNRSTPRVLVCFLALLVALTVSTALSSASSKSSDSAAVVDLLLPNKTDPRWQQAAAIFGNRLHQLDPKATVVPIFSAGGAESTQLQQAQAAISYGAKILVVAPVNPGKAGAIVALSQKKKAAVIALDAPIEAKRLSLFVGFNPKAVGGMQGKYIAAHVPRNAKLVLLNGPANDDVAVGQYKGFSNTLKREFKSHELRVAGDYWTPSWSSSDAEKDMVDALFRNDNKVQGVIAANDTLAAGARSAISQAHFGQPPRVIGSDASLSALRAILQGSQSMTVYKPVANEANIAAAAAVGLLEHNGAPGTFNSEFKMKAGAVRADLIQPETVTASNMSMTVIKDHFVTRKQLCAGIETLCTRHHI